VFLEHEGVARDVSMLRNLSFYRVACSNLLGQKKPMSILECATSKDGVVFQEEHRLVWVWSPAGQGVELIVSRTWLMSQSLPALSSKQWAE
jgi:hypothetical protein